MVQIETVEVGTAQCHRMCFGKGHADPSEREFFIDNLQVRIQFSIVMIRWTGLAPWEFEFPFPGSLTSTCLADPSTLNPDHKLQNMFATEFRIFTVLKK